MSMLTPAGLSVAGVGSLWLFVAATVACVIIVVYAIERLRSDDAAGQGAAKHP